MRFLFGILLLIIGTIFGLISTVIALRVLGRIAGQVMSEAAFTPYILGELFGQIIFMALMALLSFASIKTGINKLRSRRPDDSNALDEDIFE